MVELNSRDDFEAFFRDRPREEAVAFAARAALRVLPVLLECRDHMGDRWAPLLVLPMFYALNVTWVAARYPN